MMPERPPKKWFNRCVMRVSKDAPQVDDPKALCGWLWHHGMKRITKKRLLEAEKKYKADPDLKVRKKLISKPEVIRIVDLKTRSMIRVLKRKKDSFPEFAFYLRKPVSIHLLDALKDAGFEYEGKGKYVLRTNKFSIFVYEV